MVYIEKLKIIIMISVLIASTSCSLNSKKYNSFLEITELDVKSSQVIEAFCFLNSNGTVFDINPLYDSLKDYQMTDDNYTLYFNFCQQAHNQCTKKNTTALAVLKDNKGDCYSLGGSKNSLSKWNIISKF